MGLVENASDDGTHSYLAHLRCAHDVVRRRHDWFWGVLQEMTRLKFRFMDLLLLTSPPEDPWRPRSRLAIEAVIKNQFGLRMLSSERDLDRIVKPGWIKTEKNAEGNLFIAPTKTGVAEHFAKVCV